MLKKEISIFIWKKEGKRREHFKSVSKIKAKHLYKFNYVPIICKKVSIFNLNNQKSICDHFIPFLGEGFWLLKGFCKNKEKKNTKNFTLIELELQSVDDKMKRVVFFSVKGLRHYWFWHKKPEQIQEALNADTVKVLWRKNR